MKKVTISMIIVILFIIFGTGVNYLIDNTMLKNDTLSFLNRVNTFDMSNYGKLSHSDKEMLKYELVNGYNEGDNNVGTLIEQFMKRNMINGAVLGGFIGIVMCLVIHFTKDKHSIRFIAISVMIVLGYFQIVTVISTKDLKIDESMIVVSKQSTNEKKYNSIADAYAESKIGNDNWEIIREMIENGSNVNVLNNEGGSMLSSAIFWKHYDIAELMINKGANPNITGNDEQSPLYTSILCEEYDLIELLIEKGADVNLINKDITEMTPLHAAVIVGDSYIVQLLLDHGADATIEDYLSHTPFYYAIESNNEVIKNSFMDSLEENEQATQVLQEEFNKNLFISYNIGDTDKVKQLIYDGADINAQDFLGKTLLHICSSGLDAEMVEFLLKNGANIDIKDNEGKLPAELIDFQQSDSYKTRQDEIKLIYSQLSNSEDTAITDFKEKTYLSALARLEEKDYDLAISIFTELGNYKDSKNKITQIKEYGVAQDLFKSKLYKEAAENFNKLGEFQDSSKMVNECLYKRAIELYDRDIYEEAIGIFEELGDYNESLLFFEACKYRLGVVAYNSRNYSLAYEYFSKSSYFDSQDFAKKCLEHLNSDTSP